jgi:glycerophosphoryl diester phosphodiesterase
MNLKLLFVALVISATPLSAQTKAIAHRGYWNTEGAAQNSVASLRKAAEAGVYGSEFDVVITQDGIPLVNHDDSIQGYRIETTPYRLLKDLRLSNGETLPTLERYLEEGKKMQAIRLILEIKPQAEEANERRLVQTVLAMVKEKELEERVDYISFSLFACKELIRLAPQARAAYLGGDLPPAELKKAGLTGLDYPYRALNENPDWIQKAKDAGLSTNVWTVNEPEMMKAFIEQGVDYITTDRPVDLLQLLP